MNYNDLKRILVKIKSLSHLETAYMISSKKINKVLENEYHDGNINIDELTDLQIKLNEIYLSLLIKILTIFIMPMLRYVLIKMQVLLCSMDVLVFQI